VDNKLRELLAARNAKWDAAEDKGEHVDTRDPEQVALMAAAAKRARRATRPQGGSGPKPQPKPVQRARMPCESEIVHLTDEAADLRGMFGAAGMLCTNTLTAPPRPSPPPGKDRR